MSSVFCSHCIWVTPRRVRFRRFLKRVDRVSFFIVERLKGSWMALLSLWLSGAAWRAKVGLGCLKTLYIPAKDQSSVSLVGAFNMRIESVVWDELTRHFGGMKWIMSLIGSKKNLHFSSLSVTPALRRSVKIIWTSLIYFCRAHESTTLSFKYTSAYWHRTDE